MRQQPGSLVRAQCCVALALCLVADLSAASELPQAPPMASGERRIAPASALRLADGERVNLDGDLDEDLWRRTPAISRFYEISPRDGVSAKYRSEVRIVYDQHALYLGIRAFDPEPGRIDAPLARRDQIPNANDFFSIYIDPIGTRKFAQLFRVNASGVLADGLYNEDANNEDLSPDFEWDAKTRRHADGWTAELRIPFSTLRYSSPAAATWSMVVVRSMARDEVYRFGNAQMPRDNNCFLCYGQSLTGLTGLPDGREFTVTPQFTWRRAGDKTNGAGTSGHSDVVIGADLKFRPRADLVFDATINPDFSQVELDAPQLAANTQFALFFPEKRAFFQEGADILASPFSAIYTRSINNPAWGARLTQRSDGNDFIFLTARDDGGGLILLPGSLGTGIAGQDSKSLATIGRFRINRGTWTLGGLGTDRRYDRDGGNKPLTNTVAGVDAIWHPNDAWRVRAQWLGSSTHDERNASSTADGLPRNDNASLLDYNFNNPVWSINGGLEHVGRGFRADNGFFSQVGYNSAYQYLQHKWRDVGPFTTVGPQINLRTRHDDSSRLLNNQAFPGIYLELPRNTGIFIELRPRQKARYREDGAPLVLNQAYGNLESDPGRVLTHVYAEWLVGDRADVANNRVGKGYFYSASANLRLAERWELEPRIDNSLINARQPVPGSARILNERAVQIKSIYHFSPRDTLRFIGQYSGVRRAPSLYSSAASPFEKSEIASIVYGHRRGLGTNVYIGATTSRTLDPSGHFVRRQNEIFFKCSWSFDLSGSVAARSADQPGGTEGRERLLRSGDA
jgi:hypothetical protein